MWKWIILALACYALYRLFANDMKKKRAKNDAEESIEKKVAAGEMVKDPECGAYIDKDSSITVKDGDVIHRFCSYDCRDAFLEKVRNGSRVLPKNDAAPVTPTDDAEPVAENAHAEMLAGNSATVEVITETTKTAETAETVKTEAKPS